MIDLARETPRTANAPVSFDLFTLGRQAAALRGSRVIFARSRQLLSTGAWRGPRDAADAYVEEEDLAAIGGISAALEAGVRTLVASSPGLAAQTTGLRVLLRVPFGDLDVPSSVDGVIPTPVGEPMGLETLRFFALCRLQTRAPHVIADVARLGHRLAQMALGFGADELFGPIVSERALRLGANAHNPALTRKEAATLVRAAGLVPYERLSGGSVEEVTP